MQSTYSLIFDDTLRLRIRDFRCRLWRSCHSKPIALFTQVPGGVPPHWHMGPLANQVVSSLLGYAEVPYFYEMSIQHHRAMWAEVKFQVIGCHLRPILYNPEYRKINPAVLEHTLGITLEHAQ